MRSQKVIAEDAIARALLLRKKLGFSLSDSLSAIDAAERLQIDVWLADFPSMEGMYVVGSEPKIILSSLRPQGRRNFTCAHEIGHHCLGHGDRYDELVKSGSLRTKDPQEFAADCFAGYFLMPKSTIESGMRGRGYEYGSLTPIQVYSLANWLGVGYSTLLTHLHYGLGAVSAHQLESLKCATPKSIRLALLGNETSGQLWLVDQYWVGRAVDCEVGDQIIAPVGTVVEDATAAKLLRRPAKDKLWLAAERPGLAKLVNESLGWAAYVRIAPYQYSGRSCYRFEEE